VISKPSQHTFAPSLSLRGGFSADQDTAAAINCDADEELQRQRRDDHERISKYFMEQHLLYQLRSTFFAEMLASRGVPLPTIASVTTTDGERAPDVVDWDCALSTTDEPRTCLYSFDAAPGTKVLAPLGTDQVGLFAKLFFGDVLFPNLSENDSSKSGSVSRP